MSPNTRRFLALDVFRGMTIAFMIIVNSPGSWSYAFDPLEHAAWHGFTPTDLVFPSFLFAVGAAMSFSLDKFKGHPSLEVTFHILKRTALLFLLGFLMYWYPFFRLSDALEMSAFPLSETRILGVLQRIALCYGLAALSLWFLGQKVTYILAGVGLFAYWGILLAFGVPGDPFSMTGNAGLHIDLALFGEAHLYHGEGIAFDPEGLLSTLPAFANVIAGYALGRHLQQRGSAADTVFKILIAGALACGLAVLWDFAFPINKKLWTSSYVLLTVGLDLIILAILLFFLPVNAQKNAWVSFFEPLGKNPLAVYLLSEILLVTFYLIPIQDTRLWPWLYETLYQPIGNDLGSLLMALSFMLLCWSVGYWMDRKKLYWRV